MDFTQVEKSIEKVTAICPETGKAMNDVLQKAIKVSCTADAESKEALFKEVEETIAMAREDCPKAGKDINEVENFYLASKDADCGGG